MPHEVLAGHETHWLRLGEGPARALLIHPMLAHAGAWKALAGALGPDFGGLAPDLPGHGRSADWDGQGDYHDLATQIGQALMARCERPALLIGHSFGATVALRMALERPGDVRALVLVEPVLFAALGGEDYAQAAEEQAGFAALAAAGGAEAAARAFVERWGTGSRWEDLPPEQREAAAARMHLIRASAPALYDDSAGLLAGTRLEALHRPVLLLGGERSPPQIAAILEALKARLPDARIARVPAAGHMLPITHPEGCAARIGAFLAALTG